MEKASCSLANEAKVKGLCDHLRQQFYVRTSVEGRKLGIDFGITMGTEIISNVLWITFAKNHLRHEVSIPLPYIENGITFIMQNEVKRATCNYFMKERNQIVDYMAAIHYILCGDPTGILPAGFATGTPFLQRVINSFQYSNTATIVYSLQRAINEVVNRMPLHETNMNSWVFNHRLFIVDPDFDEIMDPAERLAYQVRKNKDYFNRGWTSIGLSDGSLADKNYILTTDTRKLTPFGIRYHNPGRNLYSTYGMKGDEEPLIRSQSMQDLTDEGITRKGWNLFTLFVDMPDVFEDQIMVDVSHLKKFTSYDRRYQCFGKLLVKKGDKLKRGDRLSITPDGEVKTFDLDAPNAKVVYISESIANVGGVKEKVFNIIISYRRYFKDGTKFTNLHGNKGVVRFKELGHAIDPRTGHLRKIDVIVSAKSIKKRKNYGQILEALLNNLSGEVVQVVPDEYQCSMKGLGIALESKGFPKDGTWQCNTYMGELTGICGTVFWGVIAQPEGSLWGRGATTRKNGRELRTAGLKFSTVEFRALDTRFGKDNAIADEIMGYAQGAEDLHEEIAILKSKRGQPVQNRPIVDIRHVTPVNQVASTIMDKKETSGTVVDEAFYPGGFIMRLPARYQTALDKNLNVLSEGRVRTWADIEVHELLGALYETDFIYVPDANMRKCWRHGTGKYGLSEIGVLVNNIVIMGHRLILRPQDEINHDLFYRAVKAYFARVAKRMGSKRGTVSTYGMAIRYPYSAKAYATLSNRLPKNTVEIHRSMAKRLRVKNGDVVMVERFPCMGFMSVRPQKIHVTDDPLCKYTIRVSGNSLGSLSLDFDGDVLFIASFHTSEAKTILKKERENPNKSCYDVIKFLNKKAGVPHTKCMNLLDFEIYPFLDLDAETHGELVKRATGVKSHTGPVIALAYNVMRIIENSDIKDNQKTNVAIEVFLDKVGNSVFKQKHGVKSLHDVVIDAICTADLETLVEHGFDRGTSTIICKIIRKKAQERGVFDLVQYHTNAKENGRSNIINRIVREDNKIYFASRANLEACKLLLNLEQPIVDVPSRIFAWTMSGKANTIVTPSEKHREEAALRILKDANMRDACRTLGKFIDDALIRKVTPNEPRKKDYTSVAKSFEKFSRIRNSQPAGAEKKGYTSVAKSFEKFSRIRNRRPTSAGKKDHTPVTKSFEKLSRMRDRRLPSAEEKVETAKPHNQCGRITTGKATTVANGHHKFMNLRKGRI